MSKKNILGWGETERDGEQRLPWVEQTLNQKPMTIGYLIWFNLVYYIGCSDKAFLMW